MKIKPKCGYWLTTKYPIGGCFKRAGADGVEIAEVIRRIVPSYKGCTHEVRLADGNTAAVHGNYTTIAP